VPVPDVDINRIERIVFAAEAMVCVRRADQAAIESVRPSVIAALDPPVKMSLGLRTDASTTVPADIEEGS